MAKKLDLTGQGFGMLTVLHPNENIGGKSAWVCRCSCGQETVVKTTSLQSGHTRSCGCQRIAVVNRIRSRLTYVDGTCVEELKKNKKLRRNNTSGTTGVEWVPNRRQWKAGICFKGTRHHLGYYHSFEDAIKARKEAEERLHNDFFREYGALVQSANS